MTIYEWRCRNCGCRIDAPGQLPCPVCGLIMTKDFRSITPRVPVFRPHFNHSVGQYVSTSREFDRALRQGAEEQNTSYTRIDPGDYASITPSLDTEAIEISARNLHDKLHQ